jgi:phosphohistidine phosphatase
VIVHLLRHAEAEDASPTGRDADRRLTDEGRRRMKAIAKAVANLEADYDAILVSPFVRARQTAEPVAEACGFRKPFVESKALAPNADPVEILHELARLRPGAALLVGHQPHLGRLVGLLVSGRTDVEAPMKKAGFAGFETGPDPSLGGAELKFFLPPKILEELS